MDEPFTRRQALDSGCDDRRLRRMVDEGALRNPIHGVYVAEGLGHAFLALEDETTILYLCSEGYAPGREHGREFENVLPGGEISGLYSLLTVGEVLKLLGRILWYVDSFPADVSELMVPGPGAGESAPSGRPASRTPYRLVSLGSGGAQP